MEQLKAGMAMALCLGISVPPTPLEAQSAPAAAAQSAHHAGARPAYGSVQLRGDERILHALNRFTFGPRPGDVEAVRSYGLENWFNLQLHPERINNADLQVRLAQFPAMQLNTADLLYRLPSGALIRQTAAGKLPMPQGGALHAI